MSFSKIPAGWGAVVSLIAGEIAAGYLLFIPTRSHVRLAFKRFMASSLPKTAATSFNELIPNREIECT